jgi:hypothetical protein
MHIEQHRRVRTWADEKAFPTPGWALVAACAMTAALLLALSAGQRASQRPVERGPQVVELQRVVVPVQRNEARVRQRLAAMASRPQAILR